MWRKTNITLKWTHIPFAMTAHTLTHWPLGDLNVILKISFSILLYWLVSSNLLMIMSSDECHRTLLMISQHWFRQWLGAVRQQAITWTSVDQDLQHHMALLDPNELTYILYDMMSWWMKMKRWSSHIESMQGQHLTCYGYILAMTSQSTVQCIMGAGNCDSQSTVQCIMEHGNCDACI